LGLAATPAAEPMPAQMAALQRQPSWVMPRVMTIAGGLAIATAAIAVAYGPTQTSPPNVTPAKYSQREAADALRHLDIPAIQKMLAAGWSPNSYFDTSRTDAIGYLLNMCEWDRAHDRRKMLLMVRTLLDGGAELDHRNVYGDTPYSIAKAPRYCGPNHPVTQMFEAMCFGGPSAPRDLCLATYELTADQRKAQGLPPKG
jgi:hypothetical protein